MKKLLSLMLALLMLAVPLSGLAEEDASAFDQLWAMDDWSFLVDLGVLTQEEAAMLSADRTAVAAGRELIHTGSVAAGNLTGVPEFDEGLSSLLARASFEVREWSDGLQLTLLADGEELERVAIGEQDGIYAALSSRLLPAPVGFTAEELSQPATFIRLTSALLKNGLISQDDARSISMLLLNGGIAPWPVGLMQSFSGHLPAIDLTAWNAALAALQGRMVYSDAADGTRTWTLEVTPADLRDLFVAVLIVVRDSPELNAQLAEATGFNAYGEAGGVSFNDAYILPLLAELEGAETLAPVHTRLVGQEDADGNLIRLEIDLCDAEDLALPVELRFDWTCRQEADGEVYELLMGDETGMYIYVSCTHAIGDMGEGYRLSLGSIEEDGSHYVAFSADLGWRVSRSSYTLFTQAEVYLDVTFPGNEFMSTPPESLHYQLMLEIAEHRIAINAVSERESASVPLRSEFVVRAAIDGVDLTGTERLTLTSGENLLLECSADVRTQPHEDSLFTGDIVRMSEMSGEELAAWVAQVKENAVMWFDAQQNGWLGEFVQLMQNLEPEEDAEWTVDLEERSFRPSVTVWTCPVLSDHWTVEIVEGADVVQVEPYVETQLTVGTEKMEHPYIMLEIIGLQPGEATVCVKSYADESEASVASIMTVRLAVDDAFQVTQLERIGWTAEEQAQ